MPPRKPRPFKAPRIELGGHGRTWQTLSPLYLTPGDIVAEKGQVVEVYIPHNTVPELVVKFLNGTEESYAESSEPVLVFAKKVFDE